MRRSWRREYVQIIGVGDADRGLIGAWNQLEGFWELPLSAVREDVSKKGD